MQNDKVIATLDANDTSYTVEDLENGDEYHFELVAFDKDGHKSSKNEDKESVVKPELPAPLDVNVVQEGDEVVISWNKSDSPNIVGYHIYQDDKLLATVGADDDQFTLPFKYVTSTSKFKVASFDKRGVESKYISSVYEPGKTDDRQSVSGTITISAFGAAIFALVFWIIIIVVKRRKKQK